ncbi:MAG TPA: RNA polymerase sigma factor [Luteibaculaceae bacterium]|jgi:RNA polymerase sigma factor (sigma-70 family)|nr:RNA polymerase sigma factor [Luteibaculaceae bacterium]
MTAVEFSYQVQSQEGLLRGFARRLTQDEEESKDLLQETILKAFQYRDKFAPGSNMKAWLGTIMRNTFLNNKKRAKYQVKTGLDLGLLVSLSGNEPSRNMGLNNLLGEEIACAMASLPESLRRPMDMMQAGYKYEEIAEDMGIPLGTVKGRIFQARRILREKLAAYETDRVDFH